MMASTPPGYPETIAGDLAWVGSEVDVNPALFTLDLSEEDIAEIEAAVKHFQGFHTAHLDCKTQAN